MLIVPCIDKNISPLSRYARMTMSHRIFTIRNKIFPFVNPRPEGMDSDSKALDELMALYRPILDLSENFTKKEIEMLRKHSKQMLTSLHPARSPSCLVEHNIFQYDNNKVNIYLIQHDQIDDWKNSNRPLILYFHGGGFVFGGIDTYSGFECHLSKDFNMLILHVNFRLVPEYSLVNIIEDVIGVYRILLDIDSNIHQRLIGMGDSSGGMLWIYLLQWIVSNNKPIPRAVVLHSPWPSLDFMNANVVYYRDSYLSTRLVFRLRQLVIGNGNEWSELTDEEKRQLNPEKNSFQGFPPLYITVGTNEIFTNEIRQMTKKMQLAGVRVILDEGEGLMHTYALFHLWSLKAKCVQRKIRQWIQEELLINKKSTWTIKIQSDIFC
jgi:acetyl esterase/lipase